MDSLQSHLGMAGVAQGGFKPLTQHQRTGLFIQGAINPWGHASNVFSAGWDYAQNKPTEWGHGWGAYGKRLANIEGQSAVQQVVTYGLSSLLHEDNRYFNSGKRGFWPRTMYAAESALLARNDRGKLRVSASELAGVAAGAYVARFWLPPSQNSTGDAAVSFGLSIAGNAGVSVFKEFFPDIRRRLRWIAGTNESVRISRRQTLATD